MSSYSGVETAEQWRYPEDASVGLPVVTQNSWV